LTILPDSLPPRGGNVVLQWASPNATSATINYKNGSSDTVIYANGSGSKTLNIRATTMIEVILIGPSGNTSLSHGVIIEKKPDDYSLEQNYPNPFSTNTTIKFALPTDDNISLVVFDIMGREIASLFKGTEFCGVHYIVWNSQGVPSGVYRYRLSAGSYTKTRRMVIVN
jgi:hypothetical protein